MSTAEPQTVDARDPLLAVMQEIQQDVRKALEILQRMAPLYTAVTEPAPDCQVIVDDTGRRWDWVPSEGYVVTED